jgi:hypothetical protein
VRREFMNRRADDDRRWRFAMAVMERRANQNEDLRLLQAISLAALNHAHFFTPCQNLIYFRSVIFGYNSVRFKLALHIEQLVGIF